MIKSSSTIAVSVHSESGIGTSDAFRPCRIPGLTLTAAGIAAETPTANEQKAIDAIEKLGGTATIDPKLATEARVSAKFEAIADTTLVALKKQPHIGAIDAFDATKCSEKGLTGLKDLPHLRKLVLGKCELNLPAVTVASRSARTCGTSRSLTPG